MIIRLPILRLATGYHTFTLLHRNVRYYNRKVLAKDEASGLTVVKEESRNLIFNDVRYSLVSHDCKSLLFVRGYPKSNSNFYIERIERLAPGFDLFEHLVVFGAAVERDIREAGYKCATMLTPVRLAPIIIRKFGFHAVRELPAKKLMRGWRRRIPWKLILLRKY
ncbi:MAG TPA: hypothetical protein VMX35_01235 [Acidobacteriota bacterium]|nr:hypothetical protein [Acidobacteriota bacterium]